MDLKLENKTVLVTGSTRGIGFAIAQKLVEEGSNVIINGRTEEGVHEAIRLLKQKYPNANILGVPSDFSKASDIELITQKILNIDILINNFGYYAMKPFVVTSDDDWYTMFELNVMSGIRLSRFYLPKMLKQNWGRIIFISSESAINIPGEMIHYGMSKTAQLAISRGLAELTKGTNVTVNAILPGPTKSDGFTKIINRLAELQNMNEDEVEEWFFRTARPTSILNRFSSTDEIANMVAYLASPVSSSINGTAIRVDGGIVKSIL